MKAFYRFFFMALLAGSLSSCMFWASSVADHADRIHAGMTMEEVRSAMGKPDYRRFAEGSEQWEYRSMLQNNDMDVVVIDFVDGRVVSMNSFRDRQPVFPQEPSKPLVPQS